MSMEEYNEYKLKIEREMQRGDSCYDFNPKRAMGYYKNAYDYACEDSRFEEEKEKARHNVVLCYANYINESIPIDFYSEYNDDKMSECQELIDLCDEALEWTHSWDEEKIVNLKNHFKSEYESAEQDWMFE